MKNFSKPESSAAEFDKLITTLVNDFGRNPTFDLFESGEFTLENYHRLLSRLFFQVFHSSGSFAVAAANIETERSEARFYLFHHAEEEKTHWEWILNDLNKTDYTGDDPIKMIPSPDAIAYVGFNYYLAEKYPIARLAIASVLEGIGAHYGSLYAAKMSGKLGLKKEQMMFLAGHGVADVKHRVEIFEVLQRAQLTPTEWGWMNASARTAFNLYMSLFNIR